MILVIDVWSTANCIRYNLRNHTVVNLLQCFWGLRTSFLTQSPQSNNLCRKKALGFWNLLLYVYSKTNTCVTLTDPILWQQLQFHSSRFWVVWLLLQLNHCWLSCMFSSTFCFSAQATGSLYGLFQQPIIFVYFSSSLRKPGHSSTCRILLKMFGRGFPFYSVKMKEKFQPVGFVELLHSFIFCEFQSVNWTRYTQYVTNIRKTKNRYELRRIRKK